MAKICSICSTRPVGSQPRTGDAAQAKVMGYCTPCLAEAEWENSHSDNGHETFTGPNGTEGIVDGMGIALDNCWICHPELNATNADYTARTGTSRTGMTIRVPLRASGVEKAAHVASLITEYAPNIVKPTKRNGYVTKLVLDHAGDVSFELRWDAQGRFVSGKLNGRKVRNVSGLLRGMGL